MEFKESHKDLNIDKELSDFLKSHKPDFKKSKQSEWEQLEAAMSKGKVIPLYARASFKYAAIAIILLSFSLISRYYSKNIHCPKGEHIAVVLPDNSKVVVNADTKLSYHPIWWYIAREVKLEGEAYFEVEKGEQFTVKSLNGTTSVLGTSFNIFARNKTYNVDCRTGKVRVETNKEEYQITKGQAVTSNLDTGISQKTDISTNNIASWKNKKLIFTSKPLSLVFKELERQYNIKIDYQSEQTKHFSGSLSLNDSVDKNIEIVCKPFFLEKLKRDAKRYSIKEKD